ncbi:MULTISPECIES: recombinase family protein [unclassified Methylobacterium]|jgi:DNA invertase Pin-like site-specific DNA recombinase|uniref:recombinase family protein n=1 Tax=unclassified Methylobacterium TaxID=2615210 RepID=UPI001354523C|nr:recombinase family protein [Methylobacterium sp. 2A]MWV24751.1 resolvase [Methylobacterium sp. 2A]
MSRRVALYARVSTDQNQTVENQLRELHAAAARLGWVVIAVFTDEGVSGTKGRDQRPGYDALLKGIARREFDLVAAWSVCRLGRSLQDLVAFLGEVQNRQIGVYLHVQGLDSTTPGGRAMFGMLSVFSDFEAAMIRDRVVAGLNRTRAKGTRLGRPPMPAERVEAIRAMLESGRSIREVARATGAGTASVQRVRASMQAEVEQAAAA